MGSIKHISNYIINHLLLKPFNLQLSYRRGKENDIADIQRLLSGQNVMHIIDAGAYRGDFSLEMLPLFSKATLYAFEPYSASWSLLVRNTAKSNRIKTYQYAISSSSGKASFYTNVSPLTNSLSAPSAEGIKYFSDYVKPSGHETVQCLTLSEFIIKEKIPSVDLLKLDLQGHELEALKGMNSSLSSVKLIYIEINFIRPYETGCVFREVEQFLNNHNFYLYRIYNLVTSSVDGRLLYGDAIFINTKLISL